MEVKNDSEQNNELETEQLQSTLEQSGDSIENEFQELPEISPELAAMQYGDYQPERLDGAQDIPQSAASEKAKLTEAENMALNACGALFGTVQSLTGKSYNLDEDAAKKLAKGVAPCLVKYGLVDPSKFFERWGAEIQAGVALGSVAWGGFKAYKQYKAEDAAKAASEAEKPEFKEAA